LPRAESQTPSAPKTPPDERRLPVGAEPRSGAGTHFRVWAPASPRVAVVLTDLEGAAVAAPVDLEPRAGGYHAGLVAGAAAGSLYYYELAGGARLPDPASRFQPNGPHGPSEVVDPAAYAWQDASWTGPTVPPIVYELHLGTFTVEGTLAAAAERLPSLADLGVTMVEVMPVAEFAGRFGWGYDGVLPFAPTHLYGRPDDLRAFVETAHQLRVAVVLDVVYNHFGPDGCPLAEFSSGYFARENTEWGQGLNFDGPGSAPVREFICANAAAWIDEFHFDGLRIDATHAIRDTSERHILADVVRSARDAAAGRRVWIVGENEPQRTSLLAPIEQGGCGFDALWNDDWHHAARVALTGVREAYYTDYLGTPQEFVSMARHGFLYQGQWYTWQRQPRGTPSDGIDPDRLVVCLENHDQVANSLDGHRLADLTTPGRHRALLSLLLLGPWTPMLFQGQEDAVRTPFLYFADHRADLAQAIRDGRRTFLAQFPTIAREAEQLPDPVAETTFLSCKLDSPAPAAPGSIRTMCQSLLRLRRSDPAFHDRERFTIEGSVLGPAAFVLRFADRRPASAAIPGHRLLIVNLGAELDLPVLSDPALSPYPARNWRTIWSSDQADAGRRWPGGPPPWRIPAESASVLGPVPDE
jgi:maltooligosyltrehalose trehalohydrolase